ncbi:MAG: sigma-54-dependent Fis family transcriptional regulator, partial [Syntrophales bacterium LBB04]|nr:sigma-54-dependent Fis family transcriptional regulator [Syntrophales bacterium LBB04]
PENLVLTGNIGTAGYISEDLDIPPGGIDLNDVVAKLERQLIEKALERAGGSKTKTAELLHVSSDSLRYRIEKLGI